MYTVAKLLVIAMLVMTGGCERPYQRFVPFRGDNSSTALDTKTGQACLALPKKGIAGSAQEANFPFCYDLYKETK
jgi:hypothetical protein